jgi:hypothetical protein
MLVHVVQVATDRLVLEDEVEASTGKDSALSGNLEFPMQRSLEERYLEVMKQLQFGMYAYLRVQYVGVQQKLWLESGKLLFSVYVVYDLVLPNRTHSTMLFMSVK